MAFAVYRIDHPAEYEKAGPTDLMELVPAPGANPLFLPKWILETLVYGIVSGEFIHLSGPTGSAKSSVLEALRQVPDNFSAICRGLGFDVRPLEVHPIEMAIYEAPGELFLRRALSDGTTYDEKSELVRALENAASRKGKCYPLVWLREMGRVHSSVVQGGLLNLMTRGEITLPGGERIEGTGIAWVADSNYQAESESNHTLVSFDDALKRRFGIHMTLDYLSAEQEVTVLRHLFEGGSHV